MNTVNCDELLELIPAYSIGATDTEETRLVELGLTQCPKLGAELQAYRLVVAQLPNSVPQIVPPASVFDGLMAQARQTKRPVRTLRPPFWYGLVASLLVALVISNGYWFWQSRQTPVISPTTQVLRLPSATLGLETDAGGWVIWVPQTDTALLVVNNFPTRADDKIFQAWVTHDKTVTSLGTFDINANGQGTLAFNPLLLQDRFDALGVTLEPSGGSEKPSGQPVVRWKS